MKDMMKNIFDWEHFCIYLSGPIDAAADGGREWRDIWTDRLVEIGFDKKQILNPCKKPLTGASFNLDNEAEIMQKHREAKEWGKLCKVVGEIAHIDLRLVDKSDLIVVHFPLDKDKHRIPTYGTMHEIVVARSQKKPVFVVWEGGKETCSAWLMWLVGHRNVFSSVEELITRLKNISKGKTAYNGDEWLLLNYDILEHDDSE